MAGSCSGKDDLMCDSWSTGAAAGYVAVRILPVCTKACFGLLTGQRTGTGAALGPPAEQPELE